MKLKITIDLSKINKDKIVTNTYTDKNGNKVTTKDYTIEAVPFNEPKVVKDGPTWQMVKSHFVVEAQTKEEREQNIRTPMLGDAIQFRDKVLDDVEYPTEDTINPDDVPF